MIIWVFGKSGSGKTTLAKALRDVFMSDAVMLDGDELRAGLCSDLSLDTGGRLEQARRTLELCKILSRYGKDVIVSVITPYASSRAAVRKAFGCENLMLIWLNPAHPMGGKQLVGANIFEDSDEFDIALDTNEMTLEECVDAIKGYAQW